MSELRILSRSTLRDFWETPEYNDSEQPLKAWFDEADNAEWSNPHDVRELYGNASFVGNNRVVFNIHGNKYRLIVAIKYEFFCCYIRFIGTHEEYDKIDATTI